MSVVSIVGGLRPGGVAPFAGVRSRSTCPWRPILDSGVDEGVNRFAESGLADYAGVPVSEEIGACQASPAVTVDGGW